MILLGTCGGSTADDEIKTELDYTQAMVEDVLSLSPYGAWVATKKSESSV